MTETESAILAHARRCAPAESCGFVVRTPEGERYFPCVNISGEPEEYFRMAPEDWLQAEPAESCGFVVSTPEGERYFPCVNISGEPEAYFRMSPEDWLQAEMQGEIVALVHSHPGGLPWLSEADRRLQVQSDLPWWLVCRGAIHKFRCVPHLTGRRFEHGVTDCYTLFRDAYHLAGIEMPDFHRERTVTRCSGMLIIWRELRCRIFIAGMTGGVTARISILTIWRRLVFTVPH